MRQKRDKKREPKAPEVLTLGAMRRTLPDGRTMLREAGARVEIRPIPGHGELLIYPVTWTNAEGRSWPGFAFDTSRVVVPAGALRGDPALQVFCCGGPKLWYEDQERTCVQCRTSFVFSAAEQRFWYETLRFHESSTAVRCVSCRKKRRTQHALREQLALALRATEAAPSDADRWLELARVSTQLRAMTGTGDLNRAIDAARKAWRLSEERLPEALYWESTLQHMAGRVEKALAAEEAFLALAHTSRHFKALAQKIHDRRAEERR